MTKYCNGSRGSSIPPKISGLKAVLQRRSKRERAELAAAILRGEVELGQLTNVQVARICGVSPQYVHQVQRASVIQLAAQ